MNAISERTEAPAWASRWLGAAGIYNLLWGATTIAFPHLLFDVSGIDRLNYPEIWQCVGMIVGVYGIGYWYHRHRFLENGQDGTLLSDEVEYTVPMGIVGLWFGGWFIRRKLDAMFAYRHEKTKSLIESGKWTSALAVKKGEDAA